jgi:hypothetical protein
MAYGFRRDVAPYPADHSARLRMMAMPVSRPEDKPAPKPAERKSGGTCDPLATIGASPRGPVSPEDRVHDWRPV